MKRIRFGATTIALGMMAALAVPGPGLAHELELTSATFDGNGIAVGADVAPSTDAPIQSFLVEAYEGSFKFEGARGRPMEGKLTNAFAVLTGWIDHGDGTCSHWQEIWEAQTEFWTENATELSLTFTDPNNGSLHIVYQMHGFRHLWEGLEYSSDDGCLWEERDADRIEHLGDTPLEVDAAWESEVTNPGKGKKSKGEQVSTTVSFRTVTFRGAPLEIVESEEPVSPHASSGPYRGPVVVLTFADTH